MKRAVNLTLTVALVVGTVIAVAGIGGPVGTAAAQGTPECEFEITETDATGESVTVEEPPESVVTLNPSGAQILWEIGAKKKVTGVTKNAMNLEGAQERTSISNADETIVYEKVVNLAPDLVIAPLSSVTTEEDVKRLREAGLTVFAYPTASSIDEVRERTLLTGQLVNECEGAAETVEWMDEELDIVTDAVEGEKRPDVLYTFFGFTAGEQTHIHDILETAGGNNLAADFGIEEYQEVNEEAVAVEDPDWIVLNSDSPEIPDGEGFEQTTAVQENQTTVVDINRLNRPGPRIVYAVRELAETFHPEAYAEAVEASESTQSDASTETDSDEPAGTSSDESTETSEDSTAPDSEPTTAEESTEGETSADDTESTEPADDDGAGFGIVVFLGGLLCVSLLGLGRKARVLGDG